MVLEFNFGASSAPVVAGRFPPIMVSAAAPNRQALIIAPGYEGLGLRGALAQSDASAYRDRLQLLGFEVTVVLADTRPSLDLNTRAFVRDIRRDAEVAVFVLGAVLPVEGNLFVPASDLRDRTPATIATESMDLAEILRRITSSAAREVIAIVDECGSGATDPNCAPGIALFPNEISAIVARRVAPPATSGPIAGVSSLRQDLLPLMVEPDLTLIQLYSRLGQKLTGTNVGIIGTRALSRTFTFVPMDFFQKLPTDCNRVDPSLSADRLRTQPPLDRLIAACQQAENLYTFTPYFKEKLTVAQEQRAFQRAIASCNGDGAAYLDTYPLGGYRAAIADHEAICAESRKPPPQPVAHEPDLRQRAYAMVINYYERHGHRPGSSLDALMSLYPDKFNHYGKERTRADEFEELLLFYARFPSFDAQVLQDTLDFSDCTQSGSCLVRGQVKISMMKIGDFSRTNGQTRFSLRFDLDTQKVLYECAIVESAPGVKQLCD